MKELCWSGVERIDWFKVIKEQWSYDDDKSIISDVQNN